MRRLEIIGTLAQAQRVACREFNVDEIPIVPHGCRVAAVRKQDWLGIHLSISVNIDRRLLFALAQSAYSSDSEAQFSGAPGPS